MVGLNDLRTSGYDCWQSMLQHLTKDGIFGIGSDLRGSKFRNPEFVHSKCLITIVVHPTIAFSKLSLHKI